VEWITSVSAVRRETAPEFWPLVILARSAEMNGCQTCWWLREQPVYHVSHRLASLETEHLPAQNPVPLVAPTPHADVIGMQARSRTAAQGVTLLSRHRRQMFPRWLAVERLCDGWHWCWVGSGIGQR